MNSKNEKQEPSNELRTKLLRKLEETGYPVELKAGSIFSSYGFRAVDYNRYYMDEDEQKGREIDICAYTNVFSEKPSLSVGLGLICEVKQTRKYPWVIFSTKKGLVEGGGWGRLHYGIGKVGFELLSFEEIEMRSTTSQFTRFGRSYHEGFRSADAKSTIFEALTTACKAAEHWLKRNKEAAGDTKDERKPSARKTVIHRSITFVDPLIVADGPLYEAYLDEQNQIKLDEIRHIPISFGYISAKYSRFGYLVEVVTTEELPTLLEKKREWIADMHNSIARKLGKEK